MASFYELIVECVSALGITFAADVRRLAARDAAGRPFRGFDGLIAAIAISREAEIATLNIAHFEGCGVPLVNPWDENAA